MSPTEPSSQPSSRNQQGKGLRFETLALGIAVIVLCAPFLLIGIADYQRARAARNESTAIKDTRTVMAAEEAYAAANGDFYDTLECLMAPGDCIPGYPQSGPSFLDREQAASEREGYRRTFHLGPPAAPGLEVSERVSASSMTSFAYMAVPIDQGSTGRCFCGDSSGRICITWYGIKPEPINGLCPTRCDAEIRSPEPR